MRNKTAIFSLLVSQSSFFLKTAMLVLSQIAGRVGIYEKGFRGKRIRIVPANKDESMENKSTFFNNSIVGCCMYILGSQNDQNGERGEKKSMEDVKDKCSTLLHIFPV